MAIYNTDSDAANTAVRAYLTKVGELYLGASFNTSSGKARAIWEKIQNEVFEGRCAYCGAKPGKLTIEHLIMFNRTDFGLHHPGNIVPVCKECNQSRRIQDGRFPTWEEQLRSRCEATKSMDSFAARRKRICDHHTKGEFAYPQLTKEESSAIKVIAESIYRSVQAEIEKGLGLYKRLDEEFVGKQNPSAKRVGSSRRGTAR
jgi:hypothetical protein